MKLKWTKIHTVVFKRDNVRQGHVTLNVTFLISDSSDARAMIFFFVSQAFVVADVKKYNFTLQLSSVT